MSNFNRYITLLVKAYELQRNNEDSTVEYDNIQEQIVAMHDVLTMDEFHNAEKISNILYVVNCLIEEVINV